MTPVKGNKSSGYTVTVNGKKYNVVINGDVAVVNGKSYDIDIAEGIDVPGGTLDIKAPTPGSVLKVLVKKDSPVKNGDTVLLLEAMKMETGIKSTADGIVSDINVAEGDQVETGKVMVTLKTAGDTSEKTNEHDTSADSTHVNAPLPGSVVKIKVAEGETVNERDTIMIIEAMKMETEIKAPVGGTISTITVNPGDQVQTGQMLAVIN